MDEFDTSFKFKKFESFFFWSQKNTFERIAKTQLTIYFTNARISIDILHSSPLFDSDVHNTFLLTNLFVCNLLEKKDGIHAFTMGHIFPDCSLYFLSVFEIVHDSREGWSLNDERTENLVYF